MTLIRRLLLGAATAMIALPLSATSGLTGKTAPDFALKDFAGENIRLSEYRGDVVMINFWATWCGPCRQEMPLLEQLHGRYQRAGFSLLGVNIDDDPRKAKKLAKSLGVTFPLVHDDQKKVSELYDVAAMPVTVILDRSGVVRHMHYGYKPGYENTYLSQIRALLRE